MPTQALIKDYRALSRNQPIAASDIQPFQDDGTPFQDIPLLDPDDPMECIEAKRFSRIRYRMNELQVFSQNVSWASCPNFQSLPMWLRPDLKAAAIGELRALSLLQLQRKVYYI